MYISNIARAFFTKKTSSIILQNSIQKFSSTKLHMDKIVVNDPADFNKQLESVVAKSASNGKPIFLYFTGAKNSDNISWCPDCTRAEPIVNEVLGNIGCYFLEFNVIRENYRSEDYPYRTDPRIQLKCVPTLMLWKNGKSIVKLNDDQCQNKETVKDILDLL